MPRNPPLVSVVIPVRNMEQYQGGKSLLLLRALKSSIDRRRASDPREDG